MDTSARQRGFEIRVFPPLGELPKAIEPHLPVCQLYRWQLGPSMWTSPTTKSLDPIVVTALRVGLPGESHGPATCGFACNCPEPEAWTTEVCCFTSCIYIYILKLIPSHPRPATFYTIPKVHKLPNLVVSTCPSSDPDNFIIEAQRLNINPPGRPIVSGFGTLTENVSAFVDRELQHLLANIPSYIKDTTDFLNKLSRFNNLPDNTILVTLDVTAYIPTFLIMTVLVLAKNMLIEERYQLPLVKISVNLLNLY